MTVAILWRAVPGRSEQSCYLATKVAALRRTVVPLGLVIASQDVNQNPRFYAEAVRAACEPGYQVLRRLKAGGHGAMLTPLPPIEAGSVAERLLADPPSFDRAVALPLLHADIAGFFVRHLGSAR